MAATSASVPAKIVMKGTSQMSLHDRFSNLAPPKLPPTEQTVTLRSPKTMTVENRRLAREMEQRPAVMAALRPQRPRGVLQRLGAKARLGFRGGFRGRFGFRRRGFVWRYSQNRYFGRRFNNLSTPRRSWGYPRGGGAGRGRFGRGGFSYRGRGGGWGRGLKKVSKDELDKQLEDYMAQSTTKTGLDADLDTYMAEMNLSV